MDLHAGCGSVEAGPHFAPKANEEDGVDGILHEGEVFDDARNVLDIEIIDLNVAFRDCEIAMTMFFNNDVNGAMALIKPWSKVSLYHSLGAAIFEFIPAMLTFNSGQIHRALTAIKRCVSICNKNRKHLTFVETIGSIIKKPNYASYNDLEAHAELCYAEALLLQAALAIIEGEDLTGLLKATLKVKTCYTTYFNCWEMVDKKTWESPESKIQFKSGVRLGTATFNLMISMLPPKLLVLLEFAGFTGNKYYGLSELEKGAEAPGMRRILCDLVLLAYNLVMCPFVGSSGDYKACNIIIMKLLQIYPESVWILVFKARHHFLLGNLQEASEIYKDITVGQRGFQNFHHLCYWELMWINMVVLNYQQCTRYTELLLHQSAWSKTTHCYIKAIMIMNNGENSGLEYIAIGELLRDARYYKIRIAGKSLPMEKFFVRRCARYHAQKNRLVMPVLELLCIWNMLPVLRENNQDTLHEMLRDLESTRNMLQTNPQQWMGIYVPDNFALLNYINACILAAMGLPRQAIEMFRETLSFKREIKEDHFLIPFAVCDMAMCYFDLDDYKTALELLTEARKKYSGYSLESRLHFKAHARTQMIQQIIGNC